MRDYRAIFEEISHLETPDEPEHINIRWTVEGHLAVGRAHDGSYVVVLSGDQLTTQKPELRKALTHARWNTTDGRLVEANRISLPEGQSFAMATAAVAAELIRQGIGRELLPIVFQQVEDFIERQLGQLVVSDSALAGLLGELLLLQRILKKEEVNNVMADPTAIWRGFTQDARDFRRGTMSIEVKTSTSAVPERIHTIHSLAQIEPRQDGEGRALETVFLLSLGLRPDPKGSLSVPDTVDNILRQLGRCPEPREAKEAFLDRLSRWGVAGQARYDHEAARENARLSSRFTQSWTPLLYELADKRLRLLRRADLTNFIANAEGLQYQATFPESVPGNPNNPRRGWDAAVSALLNSPHNEATD